jgi:hypothetical protein
MSHVICMYHKVCIQHLVLLVSPLLLLFCYATTIVHRCPTAIAMVTVIPDGRNEDRSRWNAFGGCAFRTCAFN